jgi:hypothetical protein
MFCFAQFGYNPRTTAYSTLTFLTLSIVLVLFKNYVSKTGLSPSSGKNPTKLDLIDRASPYLRIPIPTPDMIYKPNTT